MDRILRLAEVLEVTGLSKSTLYRLLKDREFPQARRLRRTGVGWRASLVEEWIESLEPIDLLTSLGQDESHGGEAEGEASPEEEGR